MKIQEQVCTKIQATRLKELGVRGESLFYWSDNEPVSKKELIDEFARQLLDNAVNENLGNLTYDKGKLQESATKAFDLGYSADGYPELELELCNAFSVAELGIMLPMIVNRNYIQYHLEFATNHNGHSVRYVTANREDILLKCRADNEAEARAQMLILLFDSNEITEQAVNKRLTQ